MSAQNDTPAFCMNIFQFLCLRLSLIEDSLDCIVDRMHYGLSADDVKLGLFLITIKPKISGIFVTFQPFSFNQA